LDNCELFEAALETNESGPDRLAELSRVELVNSMGGNCEIHIEWIASHFDEFTISDCEQLSYSLLQQIVSHPRLVVRSEDSLFDLISDHFSRDILFLNLLEFANFTATQQFLRFEYLSVECMISAIGFLSDSFESITTGMWRALANRLALAVPPTPVRSRPFDSQIISELPLNFPTLPGDTFRLLYRGSRDGFCANDFHRFCDGHSDTLCVILSDNGSIFGGYTSVAWKSVREMQIVDRNQAVESFLFTIQNPHGLSPRIFALKEEHKECAVLRVSTFGPCFGNDLFINYACDLSGANWSEVGSYYTSDSDVTNVLTGDRMFAVREIEVFETVKEI
jgi:hypothetical protein